MLIYAKVEEGKNVLYGTLGNIPTAEDAKLIYKDADGNEITLTANDVYLDDGKGGITRLSDGKAVDCYIGDKKVIPAE